MARPLNAALLLLALLPGCAVALRPVQQLHLSEGHQQRANDEDDRVLHVPGYRGQLKSNHYAGYIPVSDTKQLFYYMIESEGNPAEDPVVLWLNGGPGCSSFDGFVYEMGPFLFSSAPSAGKGTTQVQLSDNPYAWNKVATMIYLDSPAGVGLSYSTNSIDYFTGDGQTAADANIFLRRFFERYPRYQDNPFFISGESYAGIYVPNLARAVVEGNAEGQSPYINLVGYLVGNGVTDEEVDGDAFPLFAEGKSLISHYLYRELKQACGGVYWNRTSGSKCDTLYYKMTEELSSLNVYDVLHDCYRGPNPDAAAAVHQQYTNALRSHGPRWPAPGFASRPGPTVNFAGLGLTPPCTDARLAFAWLNDNAVRTALHARPYDTSDSVWQLCSNKILYTREIRSMIPIHRNLTGAGLLALIYSGDHDLAVPHTGSERWTRELDLPVRHEWAPWYDSANQVGGYHVEFEGLTYATVKGAGHMVPQTHPRQALSMFDTFLRRGSLRAAQAELRIK